MRDPNVEPSVAHLVTMKRQMFDRDDPLTTIPREWLQKVEHNIARWKNNLAPPNGKGDCWFWLGQTDWQGEPRTSTVNEDGEFKGQKKRSSQRLKLVIMNWFYDFSRVTYLNITHLCGHDNCLNPRHMRICGSQHFQRDPEKDFAECVSASNEALTKSSVKIYKEAIW